MNITKLKLLLNHYKEVSKHKLCVCKYMTPFVIEMIKRMILHDVSKYSPKEALHFAYLTHKLKNAEYESAEYKRFREELKPALEHHYKKNSHHPEHYPNGIHNMNLIDMLEMIADWKAAGKRNKKGDIFDSIDKNQERFNYGFEIKSILLSTTFDYLMDNNNITKFNNEKQTIDK